MEESCFTRGGVNPSVLYLLIVHSAVSFSEFCQYAGLAAAAQFPYDREAVIFSDRMVLCEMLPDSGYELFRPEAFFLLYLDEEFISAVAENVPVEFF